MKKTPCIFPATGSFFALFLLMFFSAHVLHICLALFCPFFFIFHFLAHFLPVLLYFALFIDLLIVFYFSLALFMAHFLALLIVLFINGTFIRKQLLIAL